MQSASLPERKCQACSGTGILLYKNEKQENGKDKTERKRCPHCRGSGRSGGYQTKSMPVANN
jgi:hypothetical protein